MISCIIGMVKLPISVRSMIGKSSFKAVALSSLLVAALFFNSPVSFADKQFFTSEDISPSLRAVNAYVDDGGAALINAALSAMTVDLVARSVSSLSHSALLEVIAQGAATSTPPDYTFIASLQEFFDREVIRIRPDSVTIDGVSYSDVWLPHDCASKFRTNAFDFISMYNIVSESSGTFVSGAGTIDGIPLFQFDSTHLRSQKAIVPLSLGSMPFFGSRFEVTSGYNSRWYLSNNENVFSITNVSSSSFPHFYYLEVILSNGNPSEVIFYRASQPGTSFSSRSYQASHFSSFFDMTPFDFDWVSGAIPLDPLSNTDGLRFRIPTSYVAGLPQVFDPESETYESDLASLVSGVTDSALDDTLVDPAFEAWDAPVPGSGTIADEPYTSLSGALNGIQSVINSIFSGVSGIAESIVGADSSFFGNIVSALAVPFEPVFAVFRSGVGVWSYVVSWVGTISAPFTWSLSALGSAGSYFLSPIYAAAAAAVVLAVYKKFGR